MTFCFALLAALPAAGAVHAESTTEVEIRFFEGTIEVRGIEKDQQGTWRERLRVHTLEADADPRELPPILGRYSQEPWGVRFTPRFPFVAGVSYVARLREPDGSFSARLEFSPARLETVPTTRVSAVYPSASELPENLLRIYIQFSAPMSRETAREHIRLETSNGTVVEGPFVAPERELWSPDRTRLTLFFDPGRIKRNVGPNVEAGAPLEEGTSYRLVVTSQFPDAHGLPLAEGWVKQFRVGPADREQPDTGNWQIEPPTETGGTVTLSFPEPLDHGLLHGMLSVLADDSSEVLGVISVSEDEQGWHFTPERQWAPETVYRIRVNALLEDLAGNSLRRSFETALSDSQAESVVPYVDLPFRLSD